MTIAVIYKYENKAIVLNDFRVSTSHPEGIRQVDAMNKFIKIGGNMVLFLAGNVEHWKTAIEAVKNISEDITINNVLEEEGPLKVALQACLEKIPSVRGQILGAIGILVDPITNTNVTFQVRGEVGFGCNVIEIENNSCLVIGSGSNIPNIQSYLEYIAGNLNVNNNFTLIETAQLLRTELKKTFKLCGPSSYRKLGISPVFAMSILESGAFQMIGEEIKGSSISSTNTADRYHHYSYTSEDENIILIDHNSGEKIVVKNIFEFSSIEPANIFDPGGDTTGFDPTDIVGENNLMYFVNQWRHMSMQGLNSLNGEFNKQKNIFSIDRTFYKAEAFFYKGEILANPNYTKLADGYLEEIPKTEAIKFNNVGHHNLKIKEEHRDINFVSSIETNIFNHDWLQDYIENYKDLYDVSVSDQKCVTVK